jgi:uncharacterized protein YecE (DUF72 family)
MRILLDSPRFSFLYPLIRALENAGHLRIGISGWRHKPWRGVFYPSALPQGKELPFAAGIFNSIEINRTLQRPESFACWAAGTPDGFVFAVKEPRFITHMLRLKDIKFANFFASGVLRLAHKLGPILWQFPPNFAFDGIGFVDFFKILRRYTNSASSLPRRSNKRIVSKLSARTTVDIPLRHAVEIRHSSFVVPEFIGVLRENHIALVCADTVDWLQTLFNAQGLQTRATKLLNT